MESRAEQKGEAEHWPSSLSASSPWMPHDSVPCFHTLPLPSLRTETLTIGQNNSCFFGIVLSGIFFFDYCIYLFIYYFVCMCVCMYTCAIAHMWKSEANLQELFLFSHSVGPNLGSKSLYPLSRPLSPLPSEFFSQLGMEFHVLRGSLCHPI